MQLLLNFKVNKPLLLILIFQLALSSSLISQTVSLDTNFSRKFVSPIHGEIISPFGSRNGRMHTGTDIRLQKNDPVYCAFDGKVIKAQNSSGYGLLIVVEHKNNVTTYYAHLNKILVKVGDEINAGQLIGKGGQTGRATTTHLHFEIRINNHPINPNQVFNFKDDNLLTSSISLSNNAKSNESTYTVKKGDTLYKIAKLHHTTVKALYKLNHIKQGSIINPGQKLRVR